MGAAMTTRTDTARFDPPIESRADLLRPFTGGEKPAERWRIGTEHEKFVYRLDDHRAPRYDERGGIRDLLLGLTEYGWEPVVENGNVIALSGKDGNVSLEPAGQLELSGAPLEHLHQTCAEAGRHLEQVKAVGDRLGLGFLGLGMWPDKARADLPVMPKGRYDIMLRHMPKVGTLGLDMMLRTCTIQVNLDYASEADMVRKFRVGLALQPLATALFASSPFTEGKPNGYLSYRSHIWSDTDPARTGMLPFVFEDGFGYERYADYALDVPMYFVFRDGKYVASPLCPARSRCFRTGTTISRPPSLRSASRASSKCAAPTVVAGAVSAPSPLCGSACSTTRRRSTRPGTRSRIGPWRNASSFAIRSHGLRSRHRCRAGAHSWSWAIASSPSPRAASTPAPRPMPPATMRAASSIRCAISWRADSRRPSCCSNAIMAPGMAMSATFTTR